MTPAKEDVKKWLNEIGKDRFWLADKCSTGKRAVDKWFEKKGEIPAKAILLMQELMRAHPSAITQELESASADANEEEQEIVLTFTGDEWSIIQDFKKTYPNKNIEDYCRDKALEFCIGMNSVADCEETAKKKIPAAQSGGKMYSAPGTGICCPPSRAGRIEGISECDDQKRSDRKPT